MNNILTAPFDPVSEAELKTIRQYRKDHHIREIYLAVKEEGILDRKTRTELLKKAVRAYQHIHVIDHAEGAYEIEPSDEKEIREGLYCKAACSIRSDLLNEGYYLDETAKHMCNAHRYAHTKGVAATAVWLARIHHLDEKKAYVMGMLHDITKAFSDEKNEKIIRIYKPEWLEVSPKVWHSYTAVIYAKQNMCLNDQEIAYALEHHTIGDGKTDYAALLYIADKIEPGRGYDVSRQKKAAAENLKKAAEMIREESKAYILKTEGIHV
ncbi:MAG: bis(5'-nucleosyl)-tetraphosphatase (symmetrical) YqeK [Erysipelotrichaceae bacterium]|nr:bis(5'-nucleosyl)-tetraphosphatase (symmetrical) YqeK [Erysipelotrichaceae bacterium]